MKRLSILATLVLIIACVQMRSSIKWRGKKRIHRTETVILFKAAIQDSWHAYSQTVSNGTPVKPRFTFKPLVGYRLTGSVQKRKAITRFDKAFNLNVVYFEHEVIFRQKVRPKNSGAVAVGGTPDIWPVTKENANFRRISTSKLT
jgi:hypothetical protein